MAEQAFPFNKSGKVSMRWHQSTKTRSDEQNLFFCKKQ